MMKYQFHVLDEENIFLTFHLDHSTSVHQSKEGIVHANTHLAYPGYLSQVIAQPLQQGHLNPLYQLL